MKRGLEKIPVQHEEIIEEISGSAFDVPQLLECGCLETVCRKAKGASLRLLVNCGKEKVAIKRLAYLQQSAFHPRESAAGKPAQQDTPWSVGQRRRFCGLR